jgi:hypothetical protein
MLKDQRVAGKTLSTSAKHLVESIHNFAMKRGTPALTRIA